MECLVLLVLTATKVIYVVGLDFCKEMNKEPALEICKDNQSPNNSTVYIDISSASTQHERCRCTVKTDMSRVTAPFAWVKFLDGSVTDSFSITFEHNIGSNVSKNGKSLRMHASTTIFYENASLQNTRQACMEIKVTSTSINVSCFASFTTSKESSFITTNDTLLTIHNHTHNPTETSSHKIGNKVVSTHKQTHPTSIFSQVTVIVAFAVGGTVLFIVAVVAFVILRRRCCAKQAMPNIREGDIGTENPLYNADVINDNHAVIEVTALVNLPDETDIETENPLYNADDNIQTDNANVIQGHGKEPERTEYSYAFTGTDDQEHIDI